VAPYTRSTAVLTIEGLITAVNTLFAYLAYTSLIASPTYLVGL